MKSRVLFIHRSVGHNLLADGKVYDLLHASAPEIELHDYDQNVDILGAGAGAGKKQGFVFPGGNTRPEDYAEIFSSSIDPKYQPILDMAMAYDVIIIKSCYPNSNIKSAEELDRIQGYYQSIAKFFADKHPEKQLVILTSPPLRPWATKPRAAARARHSSMQG